MSALFSDILQRVWTEFRRGRAGELRFEPIARRGASGAQLTRGEQKDASARLRSALGESVARRVSISHSGGWILAASCAESAGVGVDLERADRPMSSAAAERIGVGEPERLRSIERWVIKEAAFKAWPDNARSVVWHYRIARLDAEGTVFEPGVESGRVTREGFDGDCDFRLVRGDGWLAALVIFNSAD